MANNSGNTIRDSRRAFEDAIRMGRLSTIPEDPFYAGRYMYMYTDTLGRDQFKNRDTREYLPFYGARQDTHGREDPDLDGVVYISPPWRSE